MIVLNFAPKILTRQTLIRFFMSLLTLTSGKFCPQNKVWSHFFYPQKLWSRANFALEQTLILFFLSLLTLISGKFCPQTNFDLVFFVRNKFDLRLTLPSNQIWSQANFALKPTLISFFCPQKFWPEANFALSRILPSVEFCPQLNFALSWILPLDNLCPQSNFVLRQTLLLGIIYAQRISVQWNFSDFKSTYFVHLKRFQKNEFRLFQKHTNVFQCPILQLQFSFGIKKQTRMWAKRASEFHLFLKHIVVFLS